MRVTIINQPNGETSFARVTITVRYPLRARLFSGCSHRLETTDVFLRLTASCANLSLCVRSRARQRVPRIHPSRNQKSHRRLSVARFPGCPRSRGNFAKSHFDGSRLVGLSPLQKKSKSASKSRVFSISIWRPHFHWTDRPIRPTNLDEKVES